MRRVIRFGIAVHGGVGSPSSYNDGCQRAAEAAFGILRNNGSVLDAVTEAARLLEDDGRFNAGSGASLRVDGKTIEMDASLMDSEGRLGVVACIREVKNPILVAREVMTTPHVILSGDGAVKFARLRGFAPYYNPTERARENFKKFRQLAKNGQFEGRWTGFNLRENWNFSTSYEEVFEGDTIGAVAIDRQGRLAVANSTGGASPMLCGRVGDSPIIGCGFYAGPAASVATTGIGEEIIRKMLARHVYDLIASGEEVQTACQKGLALYPKEVPIGIIAISRRGVGQASNRDMATWVSISDR